MHRLPVAALIAGLLLAGCNPGAPREEEEEDAKPAGFVNRVWRVSASDAVATGTLYVFLAESTLVIDGPGGTPAVGTWRRDGDGEGLVMIEEGIAYPTDILELSAGTFRIRSHNPGRSVDITLVPAEVTR